MIDRHNRCRPDDLILEKKLGTADWSMRVNCSILGMVIVDSWLVYKGCRGVRLDMTQTDFYIALSEELIDNDCDTGVATRKRMNAHESSAMKHGLPRNGIGPILRPRRGEERTLWQSYKAIADFAPQRLLMSARGAEKMTKIAARSGSATVKAVRRALPGTWAT